MNNPALTGNRQQGMSLIEMMIAMTISLIVIGAVSGVYLSTSRNYTQDEMLSRMQENARYALHVLAEDLSMVGYWGPMSVKNISTGAVTLDGDCPPNGVSDDWATSIANPIEVASEVSAAVAKNLYTCIDETEFDEFEHLDSSGTDILVVKRVEGEEIPSTPDHGEDAGDIFIRTDGAQGMMFEYTTDDAGLDIPEASNTTDWRYRANIYYIQKHFLNNSDTIATLVRNKLAGDAIDPDPEEVAQGIEYFHIMFGVDTDNDATANLYTANPTSNNVTSARIYVLARSAAEDPNYVNDKTYTLGDVTKDYSIDPDNFYRRVFTTTVALRNPRNRIAIK